MNRRHFMKHLAGQSALAGAAGAFAQTMAANAQALKKSGKACILMWMGGGPSTMDIWDLKPGAATGGEFKPIQTAAPGVEICEHMPMTAKIMDKISIIRSMSTREADHNRGRYYMHTGYVPNPNVTHPSYGSVLAKTLGDPTATLPPFVSVGGGSVGPGFLGMGYAPLVVNSNGQIRNIKGFVDQDRLMQRMWLLDGVEKKFIGDRRGGLASDHQSVLKKTLSLMTSNQMEAFRVQQEDPATLERYGEDGFGRGLLMARRLVQEGVPFVEVNYGGWDNHQGIFPTLKDTKLPLIDRGISALVEDLSARGMLENTVVMWMGEFSRTPRINAESGRDHWARAWSVMAGGGSIKGGRAVGTTSADGTSVTSDPYSAEDLMASVCQGLGISLKTTFTSKTGRPMKIANGGKVINELFS
ncbi:MAG: DUF1501 domain-containing protein [Planctomycetales bacterium]